MAQEYLDLPGNLGTSTPGFIARAERIEAGEYVFESGVTLIGGTKYWLYTNTQGSFTQSFDRDIYAGGDLYVTGVATLPFRKVTSTFGTFTDADFTIRAMVKR